MVITVRHVGIVVSSMGRALGVFQGLLSCELVQCYSSIEGEYISALVGQPNAELDVAVLRTADDSRIELLHYVRPGALSRPIVSNGYGVNHVALGVPDLRALYQQGSTELRFLSAPLRSPDGKVLVAYVVAMEECLLELVEELN